MIKGTPEQIKAYKLANYHKNKDNNKEAKAEKRKAYKKNNEQKIKQAAKLYYEKLKSENNTYYERNKEKVKTKVKEYRKNNKERVKISEANKQIKRRKNPFFKFKDNIRTRIRNSIIGKGYTKRSKTFDILGCSYVDFRNYIESKFEPWMNWENRGLYNGNPNYGWDIDHIIPMATAKTEEEALKLNHYSNLQPLCSYNNRYIKCSN